MTWKFDFVFNIIFWIVLMQTYADSRSAGTTLTTAWRIWVTEHLFNCSVTQMPIGSTSLTSPICEQGGYDADQDDIEAMRRPMNQVTCCVTVSPPLYHHTNPPIHVLFLPGGHGPHRKPFYGGTASGIHRQRCASGSGRGTWDLPRGTRSDHSYHGLGTCTSWLVTAVSDTHDDGCPASLHQWAKDDGCDEKRILAHADRRSHHAPDRCKRADDPTAS